MTGIVKNGRLAVGLLPAALLFAAAATSTPQTAAPTYAHDIRPILQSRCVVCHNRTTAADPSVSGGLALDSYDALRKGAAIGKETREIYTPGKSGESSLMRRLEATSPALLMPRGGPPLAAAQIALIKRWIDLGAPAGSLTGENAPSVPPPTALPMPADTHTLDVHVSTQVKPPPDLLRKETPKEATLTFALKVGPLPPITALAYSPDGKRLAVGGYRAVMVWDTETGRLVAWRTHLPGAVPSLAFRPDGLQLAVASSTPAAPGEVRVYDAKTLAPVGNLLQGHTDMVTAVAWNAAGTRLATAGQDKTARLWEWPSGKALAVCRDHADAVTAVCFAPDGKSLYTASQDHNVRRFDAGSGQLLRVFSGHEDAVTALAVSPNGGGLVSSGPEPRLRWWNPDGGDTTRYSDGHEGEVNAIAFSKDGKFLASASADHTVRLWDAGSGGQQRALTGADDWVYAVAIRPDGKFVVGAGADGFVRLWETATGRLCLSLLFWPPATDSLTPEWAAFTPEGYFDASPIWSALLRLQFADTPILPSRQSAFLPVLHQPQNVVQAWQGVALTPATLTTPEKAKK